MLQYMISQCGVTYLAYVFAEACQSNGVLSFFVSGRKAKCVIIVSRPGRRIHYVEYNLTSLASTPWLCESVFVVAADRLERQAVQSSISCISLRCLRQHEGVSWPSIAFNPLSSACRWRGEIRYPRETGRIHLHIITLFGPLHGDPK